MQPIFSAGVSQPSTSGANYTAPSTTVNGYEQQTNGHQQSADNQHQQHQTTTMTGALPNPLIPTYSSGYQPNPGVPNYSSGTATNSTVPSYAAGIAMNSNQPPQQPSVPSPTTTSPFPRYNPPMSSSQQYRQDVPKPGGVVVSGYSTPQGNVISPQTPYSTSSQPLPPPSSFPIPGSTSLGMSKFVSLRLSSTTYLVL